MQESIRTIFNSNKEISNKAEDFYSNYWTIGSGINEQTIWKNNQILNVFFPRGVSKQNILEIGVGGEGGLIYPIKDCNNVTGIDISDSAIVNCKGFGLDVKKINLDKEKLPFQDEKFDIVLAFEVFEHFSNPQFAIEEIKRVLKNEGRLIISIPGSLTYHWPRLFYPSLFEFENFKEFLMINGFDARFCEFNLFMNLYKQKSISNKEKLWSWFWDCRKVKEDDWEFYHAAGLFFWEQKNENNIRLKPIEAAEMFRKSYKNNQDYKIKLLYMRALLYRYCLGDTEEFTKFLSEMDNDLKNPDYLSNPDYLYRIILIHLEALSISQPGFGKEFFSNIMSILSKLNGSEYYLKEIEKAKTNLRI